MPEDTPVNNPVPLTVATVAGMQLHTPPVVTSLKVIVVPAHSLPAPVIALGTGLTVTGFVTVHPEPSEYVIVVVPVLTPVTIPFSEPMVAVVVTLLLHKPPLTTSLNVSADPAHTLPAPDIAVGAVLTVTVIAVAQPVGKV